MNQTSIEQHKPAPVVIQSQRARGRPQTVITIFYELLASQLTPEQRDEQMGGLIQTATCLSSAISGADYHREAPADLGRYSQIHRYILAMRAAGGDEFAHYQLRRNLYIEAVMRLTAQGDELRNDLLAEPI